MPTSTHQISRKKANGRSSSITQAWYPELAGTEKSSPSPVKRARQFNDEGAEKQRKCGNPGQILG